MGVISNPNFEFKDSSVSTNDFIHRYLSDKSEEVPVEIGDAILDTFDDLRYTMQVVILPGTATTLSTSSCDDFAARCVPDPLIKAPIRFSSGRPRGVNARYSASNDITSLRVLSVGSRRTPGGQTPSRVKKSDSVVDPNSPRSPSHASSTSHPLLRYHCSAADSGKPVSIESTELLTLSKKDSRSDFTTQLDGVVDEDDCTSAQQYPAWLFAKTSMSTSFQIPMLQKRDGREDLQLQMDGAADDTGPSSLRQNFEANQLQERSGPSTPIVDSEYEATLEDHHMDHRTNQQDELEEEIRHQLNIPRQQSLALSYDATTVDAEQDSFQYGREEPIQPQFRLKRGRDNESHYESQLDPPDSTRAPPLPTLSPIALPAGTGASGYTQQRPDRNNDSNTKPDLDNSGHAQSQFPMIHTPSETAGGRTGTPKLWPNQIRALQGAGREARQNSFEMQDMRQNHSPTYSGPRGKYRDEQMVPDYGTPPPSPTVVDRPRQGEYQSKVDEAVRRGTPTSPHNFPNYNDSGLGQRLPAPNPREYDDRQIPRSPRNWKDQPGRPETALSQVPTAVNFEHQPYHLPALSSPRPLQVRRDSNDSSNGLQYDLRLPRMEMSRLNQFLVWLLGDPTFGESVELWKKIQERLDNGNLRPAQLVSAFEDDEPTSRLGIENLETKQCHFL
ncbi:hypothetical protein FKW77_006021 [Venturia effusa]|uniref:Uncharacterized protein n=1 Tax=Venturia effusa TaxID=50376 RepID=A0A517LLK8_9PEZI|nr:hypothetical protein FKW77_006021 [Venturia effusa]